MGGTREGSEGFELNHLSKLVKVGERVLELLGRVGDLIVEGYGEESVPGGRLVEEMREGHRGGGGGEEERVREREERERFDELSSPSFLLIGPSSELDP